MKHILMGTACVEGLASAKLDKTGLTQGIYATSWRLINYPFSTNLDSDAKSYGWAANGDMLDDERFCDGILYAHFPAGQKALVPDSVSFEFKPNYDMTDPKFSFTKYQACYYKVIKPYQAQNKRLDETQLKALRDDFYKQCKPEVH